MSEPARDPVERLEEILADLEVAPTRLRRDPAGVGRLPAEGQALVQSDPRCEAMLREFVEDEVALLGAIEGPSSGPPPNDPFFTARVVDALPRTWAPNRLSPRRRLVVLGLFHLVAVALAVVVLAMVPESTARWAEQAHSVLSWGSEWSSGLWLGASGIAGVALLAFLVARTHDSPTA